MKRLFFKIRQVYGDMKLQSKFTLALMLSVTVPVLMLGIFFYGKLYDMIVSYTIRQEQDTSAKTSPMIEDMVQDVVDTSSAFTSLPYYKKLFHQPVNSPMSMLTKSDQTVEFLKETKALTDGELITRIKVYVDFPNREFSLFSSSVSEVFAPISQITGTYWYGIFQGTGSTELYCPSFYLGSQEQDECGDMAYIRTSSLYYHGISYKAYVAVYFSSNTLTEVLKDNLTLDGSVSYIINERDNLVASSDASLSGIYWLSYENIEESFMSSNNFIERTILDNKIYAGFYRINKPGWFMVTVLPSQPLIEQSNQMMVQYILLYLAFLVLALMLATLLARSVTGRISSVINQMQKVRQGPPVPMESPTFHDELGDLVDTYNFMTRRMNQLLENQAKAAEDLRIAEFNSLQAQINPHFLYNTMDMINWMAKQGRTSEVCNAVQSLSRFYKLTLSRKQSISTIAQEEEHVTIYVHLQNMRYHDSIEFISDVPDELMEYQIPKLTLQPVMENAILHGILEKPSKSGTIVLTGWMEGEDIVLLVSDNGVGIPPEKMPSILSGTGQSTSGGTNIAIYNTHRRLQILYGDNYGLSYSSEPGKGTEVQIRIPAQKEYQNPYSQDNKKLPNQPLYPLVTVSTLNHVQDITTVSPEKMLAYSRNMANRFATIQNMHEISEKLPENEDYYVIAHEVTGDFPEHSHDYYELNYLCRGSMINVIDGNEIYMAAGDLVLCSRNAVHALKHQEGDALIVNFCLKPQAFEGTLKDFYLDDNLISAFLRGNGQTGQNYIFFSLGRDLHAQGILTSIIQEYADHDYHQTFALESLFLLLFAYLESSSEFSFYGIDAETHDMVGAICRNCMTQNFEEIAKGFHKSTAEFDRHLKERTGRDMKSFADEVRLERAIELLADPKINIYQIVETCGFADAEEFFKIFRRKFHISPTEYRKQFL